MTASGSRFRDLVLTRLARIEAERLIINEGDAAHTFGQTSDWEIEGLIRVEDPRFYRQAVLGGDLGAAESYIQGDWDSPDLATAMRVLARNSEAVAGVLRGPARLLAPVRSGLNWLRRNTRAGSRRNIAAHYDLSNEFFALMLDPTMTYSSAVFPHPGATLEQGSIEKYDRICRKLKIGPADHVVEIGTGWGGFADHAATLYGCRVTTTTISDEQHAYAKARFKERELTDRVTLLKTDYRDLRGQFDKLVSIEMIEAVGEKFLSTYFAKCSSLLKPDGVMALQAITMPDYRFDAYRKGVDYIQRYIFPGGFLPSVGAISQCLGQHTDLTIYSLEDFAMHYASTLAHWRRNFWESIETVKSLGFDERFIRTWNYYLCYCEAGFRENQIGVSQMLLTKPAYRQPSTKA